MIRIYNDDDLIDIPIANHCNYRMCKEYYLWLQGTYTNDLSIFAVKNLYDPYALNIERDMLLNQYIFRPHKQIGKFIEYGEYEYYLTPQSPQNLVIDINNITSLENDVFKAGRLTPVFQNNNVIFAGSGDSIFGAECSEWLYREMQIISSGILKYNKCASYYERDSKSESGITQR